MKQYHYVIYFDEETKEWIHDTGLEQVRFESGTIFNNDLGKWESIYDSEGNLSAEQKYVDEIFADGLTFLNRISAVWHLKEKDNNNDSQISNP